MARAHLASRRLFLRGSLALGGAVVLGRSFGGWSPRVSAAVGVVPSVLGNFIWPLSGSDRSDTLNSPFGPRLKASANYSYAFHPGIDLAAPLGTPVHAAADGIVRLLTDLTGRRITTSNSVADLSSTSIYPNGGMIVQLDHGQLTYTSSLHLSRQAAGLVPGLAVKQGDIVGFVGHSGSTSFDHLHFDTRVGSYYERDSKNPLGYLPMAADGGARIVKLSGVRRTPGLDVTASLECEREDLNFNEATATSFDRKGRLIDQVVVNFNDRVNCGTDEPISGRVSLKPAPFNRDSRSYRIDVTFLALSTSRGGRVVVQAGDVRGTNSIATSLAT